MGKIKKYQKQIFIFITIFLLLEFGVYPCLTAADTISNIIGAIALLFLVIWAGIELYQYVTSDFKQLSDTEIKQKLESEIGPVIDEMAKEVLAKPKKKTATKKATKSVTKKTK